MSGPLKHVKVLDMSRILAGPWAGQLLADYGADVIKVEKPQTGDDTRHWGPPWLKDAADHPTADAAYFLAANRNKRSVTCNLAHPDGQKVIQDLVAQSDILIENYRVGSLSRYGLDAATLRSLKPELIYCSISAYGQKGSRCAEAGYDAVIQASAGLMSITGDAESSGGRPQKVGVAVADIMAGMYAVTAILAALTARQHTGKGQHIDVPLFDSQVAWLANQGMNYLVGGSIPGRYGTAHPNIVPYQSFATADGEIMLAVGSDTQFAACAAVLGLPELAENDLFRCNANRVINREQLCHLIAGILKMASSEHWLELFRAKGIPAGPINDLAAVFSDPQVTEHQLVRYLDHPVAGKVPTISNPVNFSTTKVAYERAPPTLGQHTREILLDDLGYSAAKIESLYTAGAI